MRLSSPIQAAAKAVSQLDPSWPKEFVLAVDPATNQPTKTVPIFYFEKDVLHEGHYVHPIDKWEEDFTPEMMDAYVKTFAAMYAAGIRVPFTVDHSDESDDGRGTIHKLWRDGDGAGAVLKCVLSVIGEDDAIQLARVPEVSIEIDEANDGQGTSFGESIVAVSQVQFPVVGNQGPFVPIAASRRRGGTFKRKAASKGVSTMKLTPDQKKAIQQMLVTKGEKSVEEIAAMSDDDLIAFAIDQLLGSTGETDGASETNANLTAALSKKDDEVKQLSKKVGELEALKLSQPQNEISDDLAHERSLRVKDGVESLVADQIVDTKTGEKLLSKLTRTDGDKPNKRMLSKSSSAAADIDAMEWITILREIKPAPVGEKTKRQRIELSKGGSSGAGDGDAELSDLEKQTRESAMKMNRRKTG